MLSNFSNGLPAVPARDLSSLLPIVVRGGIPTVDARSLHALLEVENPFRNWFPYRVEQYNLIENKAFFSLADKSAKPKGGRPSQEYALTVLAAKELALVENNDAGRRIRHYLIYFEENSKPQSPVVDLDDTETLQRMLLAHMSDKLALKKENAILKPKAEALDHLAGTKGLFAIREVTPGIGVILKMKVTDVEKLLVAKGVFHYIGVGKYRHLVPMAAYRLPNRDCFRTKSVTCPNGRSKEQTFFTPLGKQVVYELLRLSQLALPGVK